MKLSGSVRFLVIVCAFVGLGGCGSMANQQQNIFNNEARLLESGDSFTFTKEKGEITADQAVIKFSEFSGVYTVWRLTSQEDVSLKIAIQGDIHRGKFKLIQTTEDQKLTKLWNGETNEEMTLEIPKGNSAIKMVGQKSAGKLTIQLEARAGLEVKPLTDLLNGGIFED